MSSDSAGSSEEGRPELFPSKHQVAGHRFEDGKRGSLVDGNGHFFKPLQAGPRGEREAAFYKRVSERTPESAYDDDAFEATSSSGEHEHNASTTLHVRLARWLARYHGTVQLEGKYGGGGLRHVELDDVTHRYKQPAIADIKVGHQTWYTDAEPNYIQKCQLKDQATTSAELGFKVCGMQVYDHRHKGYWRAGKPWCKKLGAQSVPSVLARFGSSGGVVPAHVFGGKHGLITALEDMVAWFEEQREYVFYSSSILVLYEGAARTPEELRVRVKLVDFAHTFARESTRDSNFIGGLNALVGVLEGVVKGQYGEHGVPVDSEGNWVLDGVGLVGMSAGKGALEIRQDSIAATVLLEGGLEGCAGVPDSVAHVEVSS